jgi:hypothetical protein
MIANLTTPVHIDFTTLYGAALCLETPVAKSEGLPLSRLLSLSQLVEAVVLHDQLEFELGSTTDWAPYREALERTALYKLVSQKMLPLCPSEVQIDASDTAVLEAARWVADHASKIELRPLEWATRFRSGTYDVFGSISDRENPLIRRYLNIVDASGDPRLNADLNAGIQHLKSNDIGLLGVHLLFRLRLIQQAIVDTHLANYSPHFSRHPLVSAVNDRLFTVKEWTMKQLASKRVEILRDNEPQEGKDSLAVVVSPILLACLARASFPLDILDIALDIRESPAAKNYRCECRNLLEQHHLEGEVAIQKYKSRVGQQLNDLRAFLFEKGVKHDVVRQLSFDTSRLIPLGYNVAFRSTVPRGRVPGDSAIIFLRDIFSDSLGFLRTQDRIRDLFEIDLHYDASLIGCVWPGSELTKGTSGQGESW